MMTYPQRVEVDEHGTQTWYDVDDNWVLENKPNTLLLSSDVAQIDADGEDIATITAQLRTPMLTNDTYDNLTDSGNVKISVDGVGVVVSLVGGVGTIEVKSLEVGIFKIRGLTYDSNILELEAV